MVKSRLQELDFPETDIDAVSQKLIQIADEQNINVMEFIDDYVAKNVDSLRRSISRELAGFSEGSFFTTTRYGKPKTSKFIKRQIINW